MDGRAVFAQVQVLIENLEADDHLAQRGAVTLAQLAKLRSRLAHELDILIRHVLADCKRPRVPMVLARSKAAQRSSSYLPFTSPQSSFCSEVEKSCIRFPCSEAISSIAAQRARNFALEARRALSASIPMRLPTLTRAKAHRELHLRRLGTTSRLLFSKAELTRHGGVDLAVCGMRGSGVRLDELGFLLGDLVPHVLDGVPFEAYSSSLAGNLLRLHERGEGARHAVEQALGFARTRARRRRLTPAAPQVSPDPTHRAPHSRWRPRRCRTHADGGVSSWRSRRRTRRRL